MTSSSEAQLKSEIARLTASIDMHKSNVSTQPATGYRRNTYVNPNYNRAHKYPRPSAPVPLRTSQSLTRPASVKEVVLNGVAFQSSGRSLVRKDIPNSNKFSTPTSTPVPAPAPYNRKSGHLVTSHRVYKSKSRRSNRNMTLTNGRRPYQHRRAVSKRMKYFDKQCPRFSTTGSCSHGLTCMYQHNPSKIAICWNFLQDNCPNSADNCNLSHDPTPERTPLCLHFLNKGRCTRPNCLFPHVNVGARHGICRDFAVLGYCDKGLDCDKQHVRECPDFAEKGTCSIKGCKLPHVIRANRNRKPVPSSGAVSGLSSSSTASAQPEDERVQRVTADEAQLGDEYISLTFNESESEDESDEEEEDENEEGDEEGDDPNDVADELPVVG